MCSGSKRKPSQTGLIMGDEHGRQEGLHHKISALLEFSAADDVTSFKDAVKKRVMMLMRWGCDGATALHCAVAGGSSASLEVIKLLLDASADVSTVDANGNRWYWMRLASDLRKQLAKWEKQQQQDVDALQVSKDGTEKKDYPVDLSLPDIKNGIYSSDEFRMYTFKVRPCSRAYSHDWTECPFVHPGENARRRDPRRYQYSCVPCPEFRKGFC
ncbi:Zinc finger CCCH domain-containing protein 66, partial [Glycine soja]